MSAHDDDDVGGTLLSRRGDVDAEGTDGVGAVIAGGDEVSCCPSCRRCLRDGIAGVTGCAGGRCGGGTLLFFAAGSTGKEVKGRMGGRRGACSGTNERETCGGRGQDDSNIEEVSSARCLGK